MDLFSFIFSVVLWGGALPTFDVSLLGNEEGGRFTARGDVFFDRRHSVGK